MNFALKEAVLGEDHGTAQDDLLQARLGRQAHLMLFEICPNFTELEAPRIPRGTFLGMSSHNYYYPQM